MRGREWRRDEIRVLHEHPEMTAAELAGLLPGRSANSVRLARQRYGRWRGAQMLCVACDSRPVWAESPHASRMGLCHGCYVREMRLRQREEREANAVRQARYKQRLERRKRKGR